MKGFKKWTSVCMVVVFCLTAALGMTGCFGSKGIVIYVDGGGANGNFNTTASMEKTPENPYPYNTLETLAGEYMQAHPDVKIVINKNSLNSDRETIVSLLSQKQAPHLLYQVTPSLEEDVSKGYYADLTEYLDQPNPYVEDGVAGAEKWRELYNEKELLATQASNGRYYEICLEKIPIGILYNKDLFAKAGITEIPQTFGALLGAQKQISEKAGVNPYYPIYDWYDIFLEVSIFSRMFDRYDVLVEDGFISTEEMVRAYVKGEWGISPNPTTEAEKMYKEYVKLVKQKTKYYPEAFESYDALEEFLKGNVAMIEATGGHMAKVAGDETIDFDVDVFGFPMLTEEDSEYGGNGVYRGTAGLATGYFVTNAAVADGEETVAACVDFLRFLSAPEYNNRLINDLGLGLPISPDADSNPLFAPLVKMYNEDLNDARKFDWNTYCSWNAFNKAYYDSFLNSVWAYQAGEYDIDDVLTIMRDATVTAVDDTMKLNGWNENRWG